MVGDDSDHVLLRRASDGCHDALATLLARHGSTARRSITGRIPYRFRSLLNEDDVMQETYADAFLSIRQCEGQSAEEFSAWLARIASNNLRDAIRILSATKRGGDRSHLPSGISNLFADLQQLLYDTGTTPSQKVMRQESAAALVSALNQLPAAYQQIVRAYDLEGQPVDQVARACKCSPGAVYMRRMRAHRILYEMLAVASSHANGTGGEAT